MRLPVVLRPEARAEFDDAFDWYDGQRPGLGAEFAGLVQEILDRIAHRPHLSEQVFPTVRRAVVRRFPYSIFYQVEPHQVVVLAVFHSKRDPKIWQARV
jgi:plasmid stabilization system protein ParE